MARGRNDGRGGTPGRGRPGKGSVVVAIVVAALGVGIWLLSQNIAGVSRPAAPAPTINLLPPPPPPPPPPPQPKTPPPPTEKPMETPNNKPQDTPKPDNQPKQLTIAGPAQAGTDAFGVGAGKGGGSSVIGGGGGGPGGGGGGFEEASYARFLQSEIQQAVTANSRIDRAFSIADVAISFSRDGHVTGVRIRRSTGNAKIDSELLATLERMRPLSEPPPPQFQFPREVRVRGVRG
jgi:protein TonB